MDTRRSEAVPRIAESLPECTASATADDAVDVAHQAEHADARPGAGAVLPPGVVRRRRQRLGREESHCIAVVETTRWPITDDLRLRSSAWCRASRTHNAGRHAAHRGGGDGVHPEGGATCRPGRHVSTPSSPPGGASNRRLPLQFR